MDQINTTPRRYTTHPVLLLAAVAVLLFCSVGIAAILGWLPESVGGGARHIPADTYASAPAMGPPLADVPTQMAMTEAAAPAPPAGYRDNAQEAAPLRTAAPPCHSCGVVSSVQASTVRGQGSGVGAAGGAVVGGLLGHQLGGGHGRDLATIAGAVGGAVVGNQVEGNMKASHRYTVRVRLDDGKYRSFHTSSPNWQAGDHVRIVNGALQRR
jgi:outer membrane lipoprotein SlyB